ncbi:cyclic nucleotide-binding domain-containing protein [Mesorhizobium sp. M0138]|uniref:cyclic nucleotide-binding domain-containing protein n=1 Tax=Mesorhizobium sp. M0138 TaxID=2956891 RepID=UPI00333D1078
MLVCQHARGKHILSALEDISDVLFVLEGRVPMKNYSQEGRELIYSGIGTGDLFGELSAIDPGMASDYSRMLDHSDVEGAQRQQSRTAPNTRQREESVARLAVLLSGRRQRDVLGAVE